jgi:phytoene/squalene synthetase
MLRRPLLLIQGTLLNRTEPDLDRLRSIDDPDRFGWAVLPHVARSFAASVVLLPAAQASAARVGYLYARMLDTYEDMVADPAERTTGLRWFANRFRTGDLSEPMSAVSMHSPSSHEQVHTVLVERCALIDRLYEQLPADDRAAVATMVVAMASSMEAWGDTFTDQGGVLTSAEQLEQYCDDVIGEPARFAVHLLVRNPLDGTQHQRVRKVSELIQLANVTRDIERDLARGVAYHPALRPHVGAPPTSASAVKTVKKVREELLVRALRCVPSYVELIEDLPLPRLSLARGSAVVMLLFTDRYYRGCAVAAGHASWSGPRSTMRIIGSALAAVVSKRWTRRISRRVEQRFLDAAVRISR